MNKLNKNEDLFLTFIIKEKELAEIKKTKCTTCSKMCITKT